jgi:hypothetical protein
MDGTLGSNGTGRKEEEKGLYLQDLGSDPSKLEKYFGKRSGPMRFVLEFKFRRFTRNFLLAFRILVKYWHKMEHLYLEFTLIFGVDFSNGTAANGPDERSSSQSPTNTRLTE